MCFASRTFFYMYVHCNVCHMFDVSLSNKTTHLVIWYIIHIVLDSLNKAYCSNKSLLYIPE